MLEKSSIYASCTGGKVEKKQGLSFVDINRICDAMDADLCIEIRKRNKQNAEKQAIEAQIAELQAKLKTM